MKWENTSRGHFSLILMQIGHKNVLMKSMSTFRDLSCFVQKWVKLWNTSKIDVSLLFSTVISDSPNSKVTWRKIGGRKTPSNLEMNY